MIRKFNLTIQVDEKTTVTNDNSIVNNNKVTTKLLSNAFTLVEEGIYVGQTNSWQIEKELIKEILPPSPEVIDVQDKKMYRWPHLDLPRQKVDLLKEKFNCKITRSIDKADIEVISINTMRKLMETNWYPSYNYSGMYDLLSFLKKSDSLTADSLIKCKELLEGIPKDSRIHISKTYFHGNSSHIADANRIISNYIEAERDKLRDDGGREILVKGQDNILKYHSIINTTSQIVFDVDINNLIDKDLAVIENTELENIQQMITSSDRDNRSLALEMLANCNVNASFDVVSNIYYWQYDWLKDTNNWNTVNVKALRSKMKAFEGGGSLSNCYCYNNYIKNLIHHDKLTKFAIDNTREKMYKHILSPLVGNDREDTVFHVSLEALQLRDNLIENINND